MSEQVIKVSENAAERIKEIMSRAEDKAIGVRVGVKSGGCELDRRRRTAGTMHAKYSRFVADWGLRPVCNCRG